MLRYLTVKVLGGVIAFLVLVILIIGFIALRANASANNSQQLAFSGAAPTYTVPPMMASPTPTVVPTVSGFDINLCAKTAGNQPLNTEQSNRDKACRWGNTTAPTYTVAPKGSTAPNNSSSGIPSAPPAPAPTVAAMPGTFAYTPGGEGFGDWATDVILPNGETNCGRIWRATNLKELPWTFVLCNFKTSAAPPKMQWPNPTSFTVTGNGTVEFDLYRDQGAVTQLKTGKWNWDNVDPYDQANAQKSPLGLGWFADGFNGTITITNPSGTTTSRTLDGGGVHQADFPRDWTGHYHVVLQVNSGQLHFWQGERFTSTNTWDAK